MSEAATPDPRAFRPHLRRVLAVTLALAMAPATTLLAASCRPDAQPLILAAGASAVASAGSGSDAVLDQLARVERGQGRDVVRDLSARIKTPGDVNDALTMAVLAAAYSADGADSEARQWAERSMQAAGNSSATAAVATVTSTVYFRLGLREEGLVLLRRGAQLYRAAGDRPAAALVSLNLARASRQPDEQRQMIDAVLAEWPALTQTFRGRKAAVETLRLAAELLPDAGLPGLNRPLETLAAAASAANDRPAQADIQFARALLAERRAAWGAVVRHNDAALTLAASGSVAVSPDWLWQRGRALRAQGEPDRARSIYADLIARLEQLKPAIDPALLGAGSTFRERYGDAYLEYADLLLGRARGTGGDERQTLLRRVREVTEFSKLVEVADYYRDPCIASAVAPRTVEAADARAITLYPIVFADRIELLVSRQSQISLATVTVPRAELVKLIGEFRLLLEKRATRQHLRPSRRLYDLLIRPIEATVFETPGTLVIVPDAILRTMPFAALNDGEKYLVEKTSIGTTISLSLTDPRKIDAVGVRAAVLGLTEARLGFAELPAVKEETGRISKLLQTQPQLDEGFTRNLLITNLSSAAPSIVHIASHGQFATDPRESFLLTYDARMDIDTLRAAVGAGAARSRSLELLMLSACQTAAGDERSAMGLAGVALRSGARSALASLWFVNDDSTAELSSRFYENLITRKMTRADSLRAAQVAMIRDERYAHPAYWAPFLMIGSWL